MSWLVMFGGMAIGTWGQLTFHEKRHPNLFFGASNISHLLLAGLIFNDALVRLST